MLSMKYTSVGFFCAVLWSATAEARPTLRLEYSRKPGAERCLDEHAFTNIVADRLGFDPFEQSASARLVVTMAFRPPRSYEGRAELHDGQTVRWVESSPAVPNCTSALRALGLAVSVRLRESQDDTPPPSTAPVPPSFTAPTAPEQPAPTLPVSERSSIPLLAFKSTASPSAGQEADRRWRLGLDGGLSIATVPGEFAAEFALSAAYMLSPVSFGAEFRFTAPGTNEYVRGFRLLGGLVPCVHFRIKASPEFFTCVVAQVGPFFESGLAPPLAKSESMVLPYVGLGPRLGVEVPLIASRLAVRGGGDVMFAVVWPRVTVDDGQRVVWASSIVSGVIEVGLVLSL
jgi:hypothetical protein